MGRASQGHVLADRADHLLDGLGNRRLAASIFGGGELIDIALDLECGSGDGAHHLLEFLIAGDEVGLGVDLDERGLLGVGGKPDQALGRDAAGFLGGLGKPLGPQPIDRDLHVALGLVQCRLAIHHARAGLLAQVLHHGCGNRRHALPLSLRLVW